MHQIDSNLYDAWQRVVERCRRDPVETLRRALRQMGKGLNQPMRDWCLCLRASDRRIDSGDVIIEALPDEDLCIEDDMNELIGLRKAHLVTLEGRDVRRLTAPIHVHLPGVPQKELAKMAGVKRGFTSRWIKAGHASVVDIGPRGEKIVWTPGGLDPNNYNGRPPDPMWGTMWRQMHEEFPLEYRQRLMRVPWFIHRLGRRKFQGFEWLCPGRYVRVRAGARVGAVDLPSSRGGRSAALLSAMDCNDAEAFGRWAAANGGVLLANGSWEFADDPREAEGAVGGASVFSQKPYNGEVPDEADACTATAEPAQPKVRESPKRERQIEHERCARFLSLTLPPLSHLRRPGECAEVEYVHVPCGRRCHFLYAPMPVWTLVAAMGFDEGLPLPEGCGLGSTWRPTGQTIAAGQGWRSFACKKCWGVRAPSQTTYRGWNDFVTLVSGGLLLGRDVPRPDNKAPLTRKRERESRRSIR
ncbi:MAG TPA: hypothetical protein VMS30_08935 [Phycisphaerales bacterium]|nr:hypothetical protein [Phycisphaerales bacterium]